MKKQILALLAIFTFGAFLFTSCETDDAVINTPADAFIDLGDEFDPMEGVTVDNGNLEDVEHDFTPSFDNKKVNHYVLTYTLGQVTATRNVYVRANNIAGNYTVNDVVTGYEAGTYNYNVTVDFLTAGDPADRYNKLILREFSAYMPLRDFTVTIDGTHITLPPTQPDGWLGTLEGSGTFKEDSDGNFSIVNITYNYSDDDESGTGIATFSRQ